MRKNFCIPLFLLLLFGLCNACNDRNPLEKEHGGGESNDTYQEASYVRIAALGSSPEGGSWLLNKQNGLQKDYTADDILEMIDELKPDCLERFITGQPDPGEALPVRERSPSMTVLQFLDAAIQSGSEECHIIPALSLSWLAGQENTFWESAQAYYNMSLERPIRSIHLNDWAAYCKNIHKTAQERSNMLQRLREIGYEEIFVDFTENLEANDPGIDGACLHIDPLTWRANDNHLKKVKSYPNITKVLLCIDPPATLEKFKLNAVDKQADIFCHTLYANQKMQGYNFVFPVMDGSWNSRVYYTSAGRSYKGNSLFEVSRDLITEGSFQGNDPGPRDEVEQGEAEPPTSGLPEKYIRMIVWADPYENYTNRWMLTKAKYPELGGDYTAQDLLEMIEEIKPDCLERFVTGTGAIESNHIVPVRAGYPPMNLAEFLQKAQEAGAPGCHIVPKLNLQWLVNNIDDPMGNNLFWRSAQALYDLPLNPPIRMINLDVWDAYVSSFTLTERDAMFKRLRDIGYEKIYVNYTGNSNANHEEVDGACFNINTTTWTINETTLNKLKGYKNLEKIFLYIDYPGAMEQFRANSPDRQADIYCNNIYPYQQTKGFTFVYALFQDGWDPHVVVTSPTGIYKGKTMYEISKELLLYGAVQ